METIKIGPYEYKLLRGDHPTGDDGTCSVNKLEIRIGKHENATREADTILHECLHAIWDLFGLEEKADEETAIHAFAVGIRMLIRDNPELKRMIFKK